MVAFLLPVASKVIDAAIAKIPDDAELGEKLIDICLHILTHKNKDLSDLPSKKSLTIITKLLNNIFRFN